MSIQNPVDYAVQFGKTVDKGRGGGPLAFPFWYNFIPDEEDNWDQVKGSGTLQNLEGIGVPVAPGTTVNHAVRMDSDYNFRLLWIKYTVYYWNPAGLYEWYNNEAGFFLYQFDYQHAIGTPLVNFLDVSVTAKGPDGRYLYGGMNLNAVTNNRGSLDPHPVENLQGYDFGYGQLRTPYLLPRSGLVNFEITNTHPTKTLKVGGCIFGMKVRI